MRRPIFLVLFLSLAAFAASGTQAQDGSDAVPKVGRDTQIAHGKAIHLPRPEYPSEARAARVTGHVRASVVISADGRVTSATAISGPQELRGACEAAAMMARFTPTRVSGIPVATTGTVSFTFVQPLNWENVGKMLGNLELDKLVTADYSKWELQVIQDVGTNAKTELFSVLKQAKKEIDIDRSARLAKTLDQQLRKSQPVEAWYFQLGRSHARLDEFASKPEMANLFAAELIRLKDLLENAPAAIPPYRLDTLVRIVATYHDGSDLTKTQKQEIVDLLAESYNKASGNE